MAGPERGRGGPAAPDETAEAQNLRIDCQNRQREWGESSVAAFASKWVPQSAEGNP